MTSTATIVFILPYPILPGNPVNLANELFTVSLYAHSMVWAISSSFLFIDLLVLYLRNWIMTKQVKENFFDGF